MSKRKFSLISLTAAVSAVLAFGAAAHSATKTYVPVGPKVVKVVAGQPFDPVPSSGPSKISVVMCAEETEPATFSVSYAKPLADVRVAAVGDFVGPGKIARLNFEVSRVEGDELYNRVSATSGAIFTECDIGPRPTQFWVDVTVPRRTPPGIYKGAIGLYYKNKTFDVISMQVHVLPVRLIGSCKQYAAYTSYGPAGGNGERVCDDSYSQFLSSFAKLGVRLATVNACPSDMQSALAAYKAAGLSGHVLIGTYAFGSAEPSYSDIQSIESAKRAAGLSKSMYFANDEPATQSQIKEALDDIEAFHSAGATASVRPSTENSLAQLEPALDELIYPVDAAYVQSLISGKGTARQTRKWQWYWWDARESAHTNRLYAGVGLWRSGFYGGMAAWMPQAAGAGEEPRGAVDSTKSLKIEALREGIDDTRYLTSYMKLLREVKDLKRAKDKEYVAATEDYVSRFMSKPINQVKTSDLVALRAKLVEYTRNLESRLK